MAKRIRLSDDNGSTWYTLPGNSGELNNEAGTIEDTIFGQSFSSTQTGLVGASIQANGLYKGFAGYVAVIKKGGTPTAMTDEAMTLVSGKTYKISNAAKNFWDHTASFTFEDGGTPIDAANVESIDHLFGRVTFISAYTPSGAITVATGTYLPMTQIARGTGFSLGQQAAMTDDTDYETAQGNDGHREYIYGLKSVSLELNGIYALSNGFRALLDAREELYIELNPDGNSKSTARGIFKAVNTGQSGDVGDQEQEKISLELSVPDDSDVVAPFKWLHESDTTLSQAIQIALDAWQDGTTIDAQYLPDGSTGISADVLVSEVSLSGGLDAMNEFSVGLQISGTLSAVS